MVRKPHPLLDCLFWDETEATLPTTPLAQPALERERSVILPEEGVVGGVGDAQQRAARLARTFSRATSGVGSLDRRDVHELARSTTRRNFQLEPRDVLHCRTWSSTGLLACY